MSTSWLRPGQQEKNYKPSGDWKNRVTRNGLSSVAKHTIKEKSRKDEAAFSDTETNLGQIADSDIWTPLDRNAHHFRLIKLKAGRTPQPVSCSIYNEPLKRSTVYEALSYVWGDPTKVKDIRVNGHVLPVSENLYKALCRLRRPGQPRVLWVDAICINQKDDLEKSYQVNLMSRIYTFASSVVIFLGDVPPEDERGTINAFDTFKDQTYQSSTGSKSSSRDSIYRCYERVISSPWFTRAWTVQEAILARKLVVMLGPCAADFDEILECEVRLWRTLRDAKFEVMPGKYGEVASMRKLRRYSSGKGLTFLGAIQQHWNRQATDRRDKVYAVLDIVNDWQGFEEISSNYALVEDQVFARTTYEILRRQRSLEFLSCVVYSDVSKGKPSWVPPFNSTTLKQAALRPRSRASGDIHLYDTAVLSLSGRFLGGTTSASLKNLCAITSTVEADKVYNNALELATGTSGMLNFISMMNRLLLSTKYGGSPEMIYLRDLTGQRKSLLQPKDPWIGAHASSSWVDTASDDEVWDEFRAFLQANGGVSVQQTGETTVLAALNSVIKRWMCWRSNEIACTQKQSGASEYVGAFGEHMDDFDIGLLLRDEPARATDKRFVFTTEDGGMGFAPSVAPGDELWALEDYGTPFMLRPAGSRTIIIGQKEESVQTYQLICRCLSMFHPDEFDILNPQLECNKVGTPERRIYLC